MSDQVVTVSGHPPRFCNTSRPRANTPADMADTSVRPAEWFRLNSAVLEGIDPPAWHWFTVSGHNTWSSLRNRVQEWLRRFQLSW